ncbi:MAG: 3-carboxymuconate cyclase [Paenibacillus sp.]|nr:3-carboxymuconate cyclase [Paenibacillus sp.]
MANHEGQLYVFVGSYAGIGDNGVQVFTFDEDSGSLTLRHQYDGLSNPTFLNVDAARARLYAIADYTNESGKKAGEAVSYTIDKETGALAELNRAATTDSTTCHVQRDVHSRFLTFTSYHGGMIGLSKIQGDGSIGPILDVAQHVGSSTGIDPQDKPHPHSSFYSPDGRFLFVQDLGLDRIVSYIVDAEAGKLVKHNETEIHAGAGPRHFAFHPEGRFAYVINELDSTVTAFRYDAEGGILTKIETVSTLPDGFEGENGCAEIAISRDGKYVYGSNRGHDSIVVYQADPDNGSLRTVQHISTEGGHPRHFALTPNGNYLIAANRDGNNLVSYKVDEGNGTLSFTGLTAQASKPVCVVPVYLEI